MQTKLDNIAVYGDKCGINTQCDSAEGPRIHMLWSRKLRMSARTRFLQAGNLNVLISIKEGICVSRTAF